MSDVTISGSALVLFTGVLTAVAGALGLVFRLLIDTMRVRAERAEQQVDRLVPAVERLTELVQRMVDRYEAETGPPKARR